MQMADLDSIQQTLNTDSGERKKFESDPVGYLKSKGLTVSKDVEHQLQQNVKSQTGKSPAIPAWSVGVTVGPRA
jgi:hypothetical protein